ncbi:MAG: hypothetical protein V2I54_00985 [Bacteroidales bacterium]|jgi:mevalonate kinase|nr:hypothetical protein [Bacteroidales bacterium]
MIFKAKILLFGEYAVLYHSDALLIPFDKFTGKLDFLDGHSNSCQRKIQSNKVLYQLALYIEKVQKESDDLHSFQLKRFKRAIDEGLYFNSRIPEGYGTGSSGALSAAVFDSFFRDNAEYYEPSGWMALKKQLAVIESFFHGKSSGLDPLVSYLDQGILIQDKNVQPVKPDFSSFHPFLIDTSVARSTQDFVHLFHNKCQNLEYEKNISTRFLDLNNRCIHSLLKDDHSTFFPALKELSGFQYEAFNEMILPEFKPLWKESLDSEVYSLKLCGAGGGGYLLGFSKRQDQLEQLKKEIRLTIVEL